MPSDPRALTGRALLRLNGLHGCVFDGLVFDGRIGNALAVAGILAAWAVRTGAAQPRPVEAEWVDKPWRLAARRHGTPQ